MIVIRVIVFSVIHTLSVALKYVWRYDMKGAFNSAFVFQSKWCFLIIIDSSCESDILNCVKY